MFVVHPTLTAQTTQPNDISFQAPLPLGWSGNNPTTSFSQNNVLPQELQFVDQLQKPARKKLKIEQQLPPITLLETSYCSNDVQKQGTLVTNPTSCRDFEACQ